MNPDENQPQSEQPNVSPLTSAEPVEATSEPAPAIGPTSNEYSAAPSSPVEPAPQPAPTFAAPVAVQPQVNGSKGLAVASLVLGIIGFLTGFIGIGILLGLVAVVLGIISLVKHQAGKGMAITGLILGAVAFLFGGIFFAITMVGYQGVQQKALDNLCSTDPSNARCANR